MRSSLLRWAPPSAAGASRAAGAELRAVVSRRCCEARACPRAAPRRAWCAPGAPRRRRGRGVVAWRAARAERDRRPRPSHASMIGTARDERGESLRSSSRAEQAGGPPQAARAAAARRGEVPRAGRRWARRRATRRGAPGGAHAPPVARATDGRREQEMAPAPTCSCERPSCEAPARSLGTVRRRAPRRVAGDRNAVGDERRRRKARTASGVLAPPPFPGERATSRPRRRDRTSAPPAGRVPRRPRSVVSARPAARRGAARRRAAGGAAAGMRDADAPRCHGAPESPGVGAAEQ